MSSGVADHQRAGRNRRCRIPSAVSNTCRAISDTTVIATPRIIAIHLISVGPLLYRVSMVAEKLKPGGAGPDRSVNTPTICGRKS